MKVSKSSLRYTLAQAIDVVSVFLSIFIVGGATSTMPAVAGGYSNAHGSKSSVGDFSTVGIVTQITGDAFLDASVDHTDAAILKETQTLTKGNRIWVSKDSKVTVTTIDNNEVIIGPNSIVEFQNYEKFKIISGMAFLKLEFGALTFETLYMSGKADIAGSQAAIITDEEFTQVLAVKSDLKVWNPHLETAKILLKESEFTEKEVGSDYLQPKKPELVQESDAKNFLEHFGNIPFVAKKFEEPKREVASVGITKPKKVIKKEASLEDKIAYQEAKDKQKKMMMSRLMGSEIDLDDDEEKTNSSSGRGVATVRKLKPSFELIKKR